MRPKRFPIILLGILLIGSIFSICVSAAASSESPESDFECYGGTITKYVGNGGAVVIPKQIRGAEVYYIGHAFDGCTSVTSVTIPDSVTSIWSSAFRGCTGLETVTFGADSVLREIGSSAFSGCSSLKSINLPSSDLKQIGSGAFYGCSSLEGIEIPAAVEAVEEQTFYGCSALASVSFEEGSAAASIGDYAFYDCTSLGSVEIPGSVESIGDYAFCLCASLKSVEVPGSVENIGARAFQYCDVLDSVTFGAGSRLTEIKESTFWNCVKLKSIEIPAGVTVIGAGAFYLCKKLERVTIPASVANIGRLAFSTLGHTPIHYLGDETAWESITKDGVWADPVPAVHCVPDRTTRKATLDADGCIDRYICSEEGCGDWGYGGTVISRPDKFTLSKTSYTYNGTVKKPAVTVKDVKGATIAAGNYAVTVKNSNGAEVASPKAAGGYTVAVTMTGNYSGTKNLTYTINKAANTLKIKAKTATIKGSTKGKKGKLKKTKKLGVTKVIKFANKGQGAKTYIKKSGNAKITIAKKTGKVTVKKGLKKGIYKVKVKVKAKGNANYKTSAWKTVTFKIRIK